MSRGLCRLPHDVPAPDVPPRALAQRISIAMTHATTCAALADGLHELARTMQFGHTWPLIAPDTDVRIIDGLRRAREGLCATLEHCSASDVDAVLRSTLFVQASAPSVSGLVYHQTAATRARVAAAREIMQHGWSHPMARHAFAIALLHAPPHELPLMPDVHLVPDFIVERYLTWLFVRPHFDVNGADARYVAWLPAMLNWLRERVCDQRIANRAALVSTVLQKLDIGMIIYSDVSIRAVLDARAALLDTLTAQAESLRGSRAIASHPRTPSRKIRLGFLVRTIMRHPDPLAFCAQFEQFDRDRYEFVVYSHDLVDRQCSHDGDLYRRLFQFVSHVRSLHGLSVREMIDTVLADDLDIFVFAYAATIGATPTDCLINTRLARAQVVMNSYVPIATGLASFTHVATVRPPVATQATVLSECRETLLEIPRVLISMPPAAQERPDRVITRESLNIPAAAPVFYNGGAADKIVPLLAQTWIRTLAAVPASVLVLAPFNPGWSGTKAAPNLLALLNEMCRAHGVERKRVIVLRELSPRDTGQILEMTTAYFGTFPHGSSTSVALALQAGVPVVTRRSPWLRGTGDASIVTSIGMHELVADDAESYLRLAIRLATDAAWRTTMQRQIRAALPTAPFLSSPDYGSGLQAMFDALVRDNVVREHQAELVEAA
jgi:predicted O-linked N-acetylglucosamine transferase (SPINDLY family)